MLAVIGPVLGFFAIIGLFMIVSFWKLFEKAGKPGWASIIPVYNAIVLLEIAGKPWWWFLLFLIPIVNLVLIIMMWNGISVNFGKDAGFTVGIIFLPYIFIPILAFGKATYKPVMQSADPQFS
jgi:hypothetical protein